ncbi:MAG: hypothetical protein QOJ40_2895 [Verrucomicrobiota bacterium]
MDTNKEAGMAAREHKEHKDFNHDPDSESGLMRLEQHKICPLVGFTDFRGTTEGGRRQKNCGQKNRAGISQKIAKTTKRGTERQSRNGRGMLTEKLCSRKIDGRKMGRKLPGLLTYQGTEDTNFTN